MTGQCEFCGGELHKGKKYCSHACRNKAVSGPAKKCEFCGGDLHKGKQFCSVTCRNRATGEKQMSKRVYLKCLHCNKEFYRRPCEVSKGSVKYCSKACHFAYEKEHGVPDRKVTHKVCKNCGKDFIVATCWLKKGKNTGQYCSRECWHEVQRARGGAFGGSKKAEWGNGTGVFTDPQGYIHEYDPKRHKFVRQHRLVMEKMLGRPLGKGERVHHKNAKRDDNRPENLELIIGSHFSGKRLKDVYAHDIERLALENMKLRQEIEKLKQQRKIGGPQDGTLRFLR